MGSDWLKFEENPTREGGVLLALVGESGSGKTYSALRIARGFAGTEPFVVLDTEEGRAGHYCRVGAPWHHAKFPEPWSSERYTEAVQQCERRGTKVLVIDSFSHEWEGFGGTLDFADSQTTKKGESRQGADKWREPKLRHRRMMLRLTHSKIPLIILCVRAEPKLDWKNMDAKGQPRDLGIQPVQDKRLWYDMTVQLLLRRDGSYSWQKRVTEELASCFPEEGGRLDEKAGRLLAEWQSSATPRAEYVEPTKAEPSTEDQIVEVLVEGEGEAHGGTDRLKSWWLMLSPAMQRALKPEKERLKTIAEAADQGRDIGGK